MIGQKTLYNAYLTTSEEKKSRGRSSILIVHRNKMLAARYYYWMHLKRIRYDDILNNLEKEFALSEQRIVSCLNEEKNTLDQLMKEQPTSRELKKDFPWYDWS